MTTTTLNTTEADIRRLQDVIMELDAAGRREDAEALVRIHCDVYAQVYAEQLEFHGDETELAAMIERSEREIDAGLGIPHEEVLRQWREAGIA